MKYSAKLHANTLIAHHLESFDIGSPDKIAKEHKLTINEATLLFAHFTMKKLELVERLNRAKKMAEDASLLVKAK